MSHPLGLPPLTGHASAQAQAHGVSPVSPSSPSSPLPGSLACDYLSFGCSRTFCDNEELDAHLAHGVHAQKHLLLVQAAYVSLHKAFDVEKESIEAGRAELQQEQQEHKRDLARAAQEQANQEAALQAAREAARESNAMLQRAEQAESDLRAQLELQTAALAQAQRECQTAHAQVQALQAHLATVPAPSGHAAGGLSPAEQEELLGTHAALKQEVQALRQQLHAMHMAQAAPAQPHQTGRTEEEWTQLVHKLHAQEHALLATQQHAAQLDQHAAQQAQSIHQLEMQQREAQVSFDRVLGEANARAAQLEARCAQLTSECSTTQNGLQSAEAQLQQLRAQQAFFSSALTQLTPQQRTQLLGTDGEAARASERVQLAEAEAALHSLRSEFDRERHTWQVQRRNMETRLMKFEPFSPTSPHHSANAGLPRNGEADHAWPDASSAPQMHLQRHQSFSSSSQGDAAQPHASSGRTSPRTAVLQGHTDALQPHRRAGHSVPASPSAHQQQLAPPAVMQAGSLQEKRKLLLDKVTSLEASKQQVSARLDSYLGAEIVYFEVTIDSGLASSAPAPAPATTHAQPAQASLPPIHVGHNSWTSDSSGAPSSSAGATASDPTGKSALFIGLSLKDESVLPAGPTSHPSMSRAALPVTVQSLPGHHPGSWSYCSLNGRVYEGKAPGKGAAAAGAQNQTQEYSYGPSYTRGDTIGVGWDVSRRQLFFTKNGIHLGLASYDVDLQPYCACVGVVSSRGGETFSFNFGSRPFAWRGLSLRDRSLRLETQHFLYAAAPCKGISLAHEAVSTPCLQLSPFRAPGNGGLELSELHASSSEGENDPQETCEDLEAEGLSEDTGGQDTPAHLRHRSLRAVQGAKQPRQPALLTACFVLPSDAVRPFGDPASGPLSPSRRAGSTEPGADAMAVLFSRQTLLPVLELSVSVTGLATMLRGGSNAPNQLAPEYAHLAALSLHAYVKDSALANFKVVASSERLALGDPRVCSPQGEFAVQLTLTHQHQPSRHLMVVLNGYDAAGQATMLGVSDSILDLSGLVHSKGSGVCGQLNKDGRILRGVSSFVALQRVTGGKPSSRGEGEGAKRRAHTRSSTLSASPSHSPQASRAGSSLLTAQQQQQQAAAGVYEHSVESIYQHSPSGSASHSANASRSPTPGFGFGAEPSPPGTPLRSHTFVSGSGGGSRRVSGAFDSNGAPLDGGSPVPSSPFRPHPPLTGAAHARTPSRVLLPGAQEPDEIELAPLTRKLHSIYQDWRKLAGRLAQVREEVASYLEEEEWTLFVAAPAYTSAADRKSIGAGVSAGLPALPAGSGSGSSNRPSLRKALIGVGPAGEAELDAFVQAGGGAYGALFHVHVLAQTLPPTQRFASLRQIIPLVQKQHARLNLSYVERMKKREQEIDTSCLFQ